jgi:hypothetical protein
MRCAVSACEVEYPRDWWYNAGLFVVCILDAADAASIAVGLRLGIGPFWGTLAAAEVDLWVGAIRLEVGWKIALRDRWDEDDSRRDIGAGAGVSASGDSRRSQVCPSAATLYMTGGARGG